MTRSRFLAFLILLVLGFVRQSAAAIDLQFLASNIPYPVDIADAGDGSHRLFLVSQNGRVWIFDGSAVLSTPFLDISSLVTFVHDERGLLGLAFHPDYSRNGFFYVHYTDTAGNTMVARYQVSSAPNLADPASGTIILTQDQPQNNHKGGQLRFGPDGFLYVALGDGGGGNDSLNTLLGKFAPEYPPPNHMNYALMQVFGGERFTPVFIYRAFASFLGVLSVFFLVSAEISR